MESFAVSISYRLTFIIVTMPFLLVGAISVGQALSAPPSAEIHLPALFTDGMVVQQQMEVPIWGWANPGEVIRVSFADRSAQATADDDGRWSVRLDALEAGGPYELVVAGSTTVTVGEVWVGEVWVASGQSNMVQVVANSLNADAEIEAADYPQVRLFNVRDAGSYYPKEDVEGSWVSAVGERIRRQPAVAYFFARHLHRELDVPVGVIIAAQGNVPIATWMSRGMLYDTQAGRPIVEQWDQAMKTLHPDYAQRYEVYRQQWWEDFREFARARHAYRSQVQEAREQGREAELPDPPERPRGPFARNAPVSGYSAMIAPLQPYAMRGVIWYQGESNSGDAEAYRELFPAMIKGWRQAWGQGEFPFLFVQLANFRAPQTQPIEGRWPAVRDAQLASLDLPLTGMAVTIDIGEADGIHPPNKQDVGKRLALAALAKAYGQDIPYSGPFYEGMQVEGSSVRIRFNHAHGGLVARNGPLRGFVIAGDDRHFIFADAEIDGDTVVVRSAEVPEPVAVRYAWADNPIANLFNAVGLPASPFRTDDWDL